ncbi:hypothetical protein SHELI_v1c04230 [Spiroplasma helicoides]|uniref:Uncharacterized protein n=1 Tax=Spiroplasma helicoides TaxID=216938 RepID=A0A1B3SKB6_9MOLU|nr:hypothetical protein [Spiroplasma helicoides]AOG60374.1 hypothetical protein SHELI_v1c04230 [Spiroplasma helicoides]
MLFSEYLSNSDIIAIFFGVISFIQAVCIAFFGVIFRKSAKKRDEEYKKDIKNILESLNHNLIGIVNIVASEYQKTVQNTANTIDNTNEEYFEEKYNIFQQKLREVKKSQNNFAKNKLWKKRQKNS